MKINQRVGFQLGGFTVGHAATMTRCNAVGTIVGFEDRDGRRFVTVEFDEPQPVDWPEGSTSKRFELTHTNITATWAKPVGDRNLPNYIEQPVASQDQAVEPKNVFGQVAVKPFYIWANEDCANKSHSFKQAKAIRLALFNDGGESVHIVDADGVEVVDAEIEAHEALVNAGYYAGARKPDVKPEFPGAFMVNDPQDPDGFAIVGDDVAALILDARDHLINPAAEREVV